MPKASTGIRRTTSGKWRADWRYKEGGEWKFGTKGGFATMEEAKAHRAAVLGGDVPKVPNKRTTLSEWAARWIDSLEATVGEDDGLAPSSVVSARCAMKRILPLLGDTRVADITASDIRHVLKRLKDDGLATNTRRNYGSQLRSCLAGAVEDGVIHATPWVPATTKAAKRSSTRSVALPKATSRNAHLFNRLEIDAMAAEMPGRMAALLYVGLGSGLRLGEMLGLTVDEVDGIPGRRGHLTAVGHGAVGPGVLRVRRQMTPDEKGAPVLVERLKTENSYREVAVPAFVIEALADHLERYGVGPGGLIFHSRSGTGLRSSDCQKAWRNARTAVGIEAKGYHDLRHTFTTRLVEGGTPLPTVAAMVGDSVETILRVYAHDRDEAQQAAQSLIADAFAL